MLPFLPVSLFLCVSNADLLVSRFTGCKYYVLFRFIFSTLSLSIHVFMSPQIDFVPSVCPCVRLSVCPEKKKKKNIYIGHMFWLVRLRAFIFHMSRPCDKTFMLVPSLRSSMKVKVKYQGHSFRKNGRCGALLLHKHRLSLLLLFIYLFFFFCRWPITRTRERNPCNDLSIFFISGRETVMRKEHIVVMTVIWYRKIFIFQLHEYLWDITHDIYIFLIYHGYF